MALAVVQGGCSDDSGSSDSGAGVDLASGDAAALEAGLEAGTACPSYEQPQVVGKVTASVIDEASGLAASRQQADLLWVHNDSGDQARVYALDLLGQLRATYRLDGVMARDFEDIALGPGPQAGSDYLYVGDIGDNPKSRAEIVVYRVAEPQVGAGGSAEQTLSDVAALRLRYPDGAHDAETLLVDPNKGDLYILTKDVTNTVTQIFVARAPHSTTDVISLEELGQLRFREGVLAGVKSGLLTGGDLAADGSGVLLRTYRDVLYWRWPAGGSLAQALVGVEPCVMPEAFEGQGEAIALAKDGSYFTLGEGQDQRIRKTRPIWKQISQ
jgi:hypothetical protein